MDPARRYGSGFGFTYTVRINIFDPFLRVLHRWGLSNTSTGEIPVVDTGTRYRYLPSTYEYSSLLNSVTEPKLLISNPDPQNENQEFRISYPSLK